VQGFVASIVFVGSTLFADAMTDARTEYEAGAAAYDRHDWVTAATRFSRADERVPNSRALQLAMASALHLNDAPLAMSLVERAEARAVDGSLAELAKRLRTRFAKEAGHIRVVCKCQASIDGQDGLSQWVTPGTHKVTFERGERSVEVAGGADIEVQPAETAATPTPPPPPIAEKRTQRGLPTWVFWTGVGLTGAAAATSGILSLTSKSAHDDFVATPNTTTQAAGEAAQTRSGVGWAVTGGLFVATVVVALMTDFK
jgi:hypothetical protein